MRLTDVVGLMTKAYLHRIIDSFTKDLPKGDEEKARELILRNTSELTDRDRIARALRFEGSYCDRILQEYILEALVNRPEHAASEEDLIGEVTRLEQRVLDDAQNPDALKYEDDHALEILTSVLEVALEDEQVTQEELNLVQRLREKLGIKENSKRILMAQLNHFPRAGNRIHTPSEFKDGLLDLQRRGVLFYCNKLNGGAFVVPDEVVPGVKKALRIELNRKAWAALLESLPRNHLSQILDSSGLPKSGKKGVLQERIISAGIRPSVALDLLSNQDLYDILNSLPGAKVSGSKQDRMDRIIEYFSNLLLRDIPEEVEPGELFYRYLTELAHRDRENLLANKVIKKDREMDGAFEEGTRFLFSSKLDLDLIPMEGTDHPDGCFEIGGRGDILMWDNKGKESVYDFPQSHVRQF